MFSPKAESDVRYDNLIREVVASRARYSVTGYWCPTPQSLRDLETTYPLRELFHVATWLVGVVVPTYTWSSGSGLGSSSAYASGDGTGFLGSEASTPTPSMGMYATGGMMMGGEKRRLDEEGESQHDGKLKRGRYEVG